MNASWVYLVVAGIFEVAWAIGMKYSEGFTKFWISGVTVVLMILSFYFLAKALETIPLGTAYGVWTGIGAVGTAIAGMILFGESREVLRLLCILLVISGIVGLKLLSTD
ncbi:MAG: multidrug efflux SMR transporter [Chloroherpetonaceae bacterium]|nr:multidrug efflux SMR transporter [Chloroherpetonaceae bacterium]